MYLCSFFSGFLGIALYIHNLSQSTSVIILSFWGNMETISLFASLYPTPLKIVLNNSSTDTALEPHQMCCNFLCFIHHTSFTRFRFFMLVSCNFQFWSFHLIHLYISSLSLLGLFSFVSSMFIVALCGSILMLALQISLPHNSNVCHLSVGEHNRTGFWHCWGGRRCCLVITGWRWRLLTWPPWYL